MENKDEISNDKINSKDFSVENEKIIQYNKFSLCVIKIHTWLIFLIFALSFSHNQTSRNKNLKDEEIDENDYYFSLFYILTLIISFIQGFNSYLTLSRDYEEVKSEKIFNYDFMRGKIILILYLINN